MVEAIPPALALEPAAEWQQTECRDWRAVVAPPLTLGVFETLYPFRLDPFQLAAIRAQIEGRSVLVAAPTGSGKTLVAEFAVLAALRRGLRAIYTTPIKALSNQKFRDFGDLIPRHRALFARRSSPPTVGLLTGDVTENPGGDVVVMTTEVLRNMLLQTVLHDVGCVVFDEVHYLADPERGTTWEEAILHCPPHVQLVCLSATVSNAAELAEWISRVHRPIELVAHHRRAVPLAQHYYLKRTLHLLVDARGRRRAPLPVGGELRRPRPEDVPAAARPQETPTPVDVVRHLDGAAMLPAIYFLFGRRATEEAALSCGGLDLQRGRALRQMRRERIAAYVASLPEQDRSLAQVQDLVKLLERGVAFHHAGLLPVLKQLVEELFTAGAIGVVFATETLALGINMPARTVVVGELVKFDGESRRLLLPNEYQQLIGRAGRRGLDDLGHAVALYSPWASCRETLELATGELYPVRSAFTARYNTVAALHDGTGAGSERLVRLFSSTLRQFQRHDELRLAAEDVRTLRREVETTRFACPVPGFDATALEQFFSLRQEASQAEHTVRRTREELGGLHRQLDRPLGSAIDPAETARRRLSLALAPLLADASRRVATAEAAQAAARGAIEQLPCDDCEVRSDHERSRRRHRAAARALASAEQHAAELEASVAGEAARLLDSLGRVMERYGFLRSGAPTAKSSVLARVYDANGLFLVELFWGGALDGLSPAELLELLSWFCYDREYSRYNRFYLPGTLWNLRPELWRLQTEIQRSESDADIALTSGFNAQFYGPVLAWAGGAAFSELLEKIALGEGDLIQVLNKTLDLATQVREALWKGAASDRRLLLLAARLDEGDRLVRRGLVAQSLRLPTLELRS